MKPQDTRELLGEFRFYGEATRNFLLHDISDSDTGVATATSTEAVSYATDQSYEKRLL
jgi:hypothetical protein